MCSMTFENIQRGPLTMKMCGSILLLLDNNNNNNRVLLLVCCPERKIDESIEVTFEVILSFVFSTSLRVGGGRSFLPLPYSSFQVGPACVIVSGHERWMSVLFSCTTHRSREKENTSSPPVEAVRPGENQSHPKVNLFHPDFLLFTLHKYSYKKQRKDEDQEKKKELFNQLHFHLTGGVWLKNSRVPEIANGQGWRDTS